MTSPSSAKPMTPTPSDYRLRGYLPAFFFAPRCGDAGGAGCALNGSGMWFSFKTSLAYSRMYSTSTAVIFRLRSWQATRNQCWISTSTRKLMCCLSGIKRILAAADALVKHDYLTKCRNSRTIRTVHNCFPVVSS